MTVGEHVKWTHGSTYVCVFVDDVVGEFEFVERDCATHPVSAGRRWVDMYVRLTAEHRLVGLAGDHPPTVLVLVAVLVDADHVQYDHVVALRVQTAQSQLQRRKHPPDINRPTHRQPTCRWCTACSECDIDSKNVIVSCSLCAWPTLLKDGETARDNHVLACNFAKYSPIKKSLSDSAISLS